jgi:hypothetical protein
LARIEHARGVPTGTFYGLGIDERSALLVDRNGTATLAEYPGSGYRTRGAYLIRLVSVKRLQPGRPLVASVWVLHLDSPGARLDLAAKRGQGTSYRVTVDGGRAANYSRDPY